MNRPDYNGGGLVNMMASLIRARGGSAEHADLAALPASALAGARHIVLLVIDGLGDDWLRRHAPDGLLARHRVTAVTSVFPPTTASAITTYLTGDAPQQHGLTGWFMWLRELGCVMTVLPGTPRYGGVGYRQAGIDLNQLLGHRSVFARMASRSVAVSPRYIARSDFNLAHLGPARLRPYKGLKGLTRQIARAIRKARSPSYVYAYWPGLDSLGHARGIDSPESVAHLGALEQHIAMLTDALAGSDTALLISADHGQIDTAPGDLTDLADHPELADCLHIPLCGEPRAAFCYVRPDRVQAFEHYCTTVLGERFALYPSRELMEEGLFGPGPPHPRLAERIGDYTLLARGNNLIRDPLPFDKPFTQVGVHGGLSNAELRVPLCLLRC
jgi:hypothetical protein